MFLKCPNKLDELVFAAKFSAKTMLVRMEKLLFVQVSHNIGYYSMLHDLATNARE